METSESKTKTRRPKRPQFPDSVRQAIANDQDRLCQECQKPFGEDFDIDHRIPLSLNGPHKLSNARALCRPCHAAKTARESLEAAERRRSRKRDEETERNRDKRQSTKKRTIASSQREIQPISPSTTIQAAADTIVDELISLQFEPPTKRRRIDTGPAPSLSPNEIKPVGQDLIIEVDALFGRCRYLEWLRVNYRLSGDETSRYGTLDLMRTRFRHPENKSLVLRRTGDIAMLQNETTDIRFVDFWHRSFRYLSLRSTLSDLSTDRWKDLARALWLVVYEMRHPGEPVASFRFILAAVKTDKKIR